MDDNRGYFIAPEIIKEIDIPQRGILSRTVYEDNDVKVVLFGFSQGNELSAHTAPMPVSLYFLQGEAELTLGPDTHSVTAGAVAHMAPDLNHAIVAKTPLIMLLIMMRPEARQERRGEWWIIADRRCRIPAQRWRVHCEVGT